MDLNYHSIESLLKAAKENSCRLSALVLEQQAEQMELPKQELYGILYPAWQRPGSEKHKWPHWWRCLSHAHCCRAREKSYRPPSWRSPLSCTCSIRTERFHGKNRSSAYSRKLRHCTGSCTHNMQEQYQHTEEECVMSLSTASAVGMVIANNASLAGAQGGCQAECGSASAMAAAAIVELAGGTPDMIQSAVATALKNILGLVCDPVAGLVEIPCIKRNASGVAGAFVAAELALAGIRSAIPADEVIWTMKKVGDVMPTALKETAEGGLAATPTGRKLHQQVFGEMK